MKVVQINAVYEFSSTGRTTKELHEFLIKQGIDSYVFCCNKHDSKNNILKVGNRIDYIIHSFLSHLLGLQGFFSFFSTWKLVRHLKRIAPDVVHLRVLHSNCINLPMLLKFLGRSNIATVITLHDCWYFTGHCCYFIDSQCDKWKTGCGNCPDIRKWNSSWFLDNSKYILKRKKKLFSNISNLTVVGVSDWVTNFIPHSILKNAKNILRIYNWIDVDLFRPYHTDKLRSSMGLDGKFVVISVAQRWSKAKGIDDVIAVARNNQEMVFLLIGHIDNMHELPNNVMALGAISKPQTLAEYYSMADVFFNPSIRETFGKVTAEAMACGTPVVAYNATATPELVKEGCGYVVEKHDIKGVSAKLHEIITQGKDYYFQNCRSFVIETFSKQKESLLNLYLQIK